MGDQDRTVFNDTADGACFSMVNVDNEQDREIIAKMVTQRNAVAYKMDHEQRGLALIFSHEHFKNKELASRPETNVDSRNLERVLQQLNFKVTVHKDLTYAEVRKRVAAAAAQDHENRDCILVALLTHGDNGVLYAKDDQYNLDSIWEAFTADKCPSLAGKPKLFIVQTCARRRKHLGMQSLRRCETDGVAEHNNYRIPKCADFLITCCIIPEFCSRSSPVLGSWFMQCLCAELEANGRSLNLLILLTFVAQSVANCRTEDGQQPIACIYSMLTRILCFSDRFINSSS